MVKPILNGIKDFAVSPSGKIFVIPQTDSIYQDLKKQLANETQY